MDPRSNNPDAPGLWADELPDLLRAAVGQLRDERPPLAVAHPALARALPIPPPAPPPPPLRLPRPRPWITSRFSLAIAGAVAATLLAYLVWRPGAVVVVRRHEPR